MNKLLTLTLAIGSLMSWAALCAHGESGHDYWPTWRGPEATGAAPKGTPPLTWSETENVKWKVKLPGAGTSSPIVWGDRIFFQTATGTDQKGAPAAASEGSESGGDEGGRRPFHGGVAPDNVYRFELLCLDRGTGEIRWQRTVREELPHEGHHPEHGFASYSPVTDGQHVWANFGSRGVHCYDVEGNHTWSVDLGKMKTSNGFGEGSSPSLAGDALVVLMDHEGDSFVIALDKKSGEPMWRKDRDERTSWATPLPVEVNGRLQVIVSATNFVRSYDAQTGDLIWQCSGQTRNTIPSPVSGFGAVFCTSGFRGSALHAIELGGTGNLTGTGAIRWQVNEATPYVPSPLLYGDKLYVCSVNRGVISCYQAETGKANFVKQRLGDVSEVYASPVGAADRVYFVGRSGKTQVIKRSETYEPLATNVLEDEFDASPAIAGNELFLKGKTYLYCLAES